MDNQNKDSRNDLIAQERKEDERGGHKVMEHPFVVFMIFPFEYHQLKNWENMNSQLEAEISFQFGFFCFWPAWVVFVELGAGSTSSDHLGEPICPSEG